jgi:hypothetical protein
MANLHPGTFKRTTLALRVFCLFIAWCIGTLSENVRGAESPRFISLEQGLYSESELLRPGKLDFLFKHRPEEDPYNLFAWTPLFKGGAGIIDPDNAGPSTKYIGGFVRPLAAWRDQGDLILAAQAVESGPRGDYEAQGEYRFPFGLGIGAGIVEASNPANDVAFWKTTYRNKCGDWNYILEAQGQEVSGETSPGGYVALYNEQWMGVVGTDGEQWRATAAFVAPDRKTLFRPTLEILYVDNSIGQMNGSRSLFANATLKYEGGFLSHPARLGRAMGPQGLEFGNPLGFLFPTWNRRLEVWEMGNLGDLRAERIRFPNRATQGRYEALLFPFQFDHNKNILDHLFAGAAYLNAPTKDTPAFLGGFFGVIGFLKVSVGVEHELHPSQTSVVVGLIDAF